MNRGTIISVAVALASLGGAMAVSPRDLPPPKFEDTGAALFPDFGDPTVAASLEVVEWDDTEAKIKQFKVDLEGGRWVIPSHHDYPADATERMGKAASSFIGVKRDIYYTDNPSDHAAFGLLDPQDAGGGHDEKGRRITIKDQSGTTLVDVIVGKQIPGKDGYYYVRLPDDKRVYGSEIELDISTKFEDWIEKDLLHMERDDVVALVYDPYSVDEAASKVVGSDPLQIELVKSEGEGTGTDDWVLAKGKAAPAGKELDASKIRQIVGAIDRLQIVGVRPRPERLTLAALQSKGFFVNPSSGRLFGNEGEMHVIGKDGLVYTLWFGEITMESGLALTAGEDAAKKADAEKTGGEAGDRGSDAESEEPAPAEGGNRYLFVDVAFDPTRVESASASAESGHEQGEPPPGEAKAQQLRSRFEKWFFVISDSSFKQIHKGRDELFKETKKDDKKK